MDSFTSAAITFDTHKDYDNHISFSKPDTNKIVEIPKQTEAAKTQEPPQQNDQIKEDTTKKRKAYTKRQPVEEKQIQKEHIAPEMKLFSVYVANGWNRVDGTLIADSEDSVKTKAFKMLKIDEDEQDKVTVLINEIKTGLHFVQ